MKKKKHKISIGIILKGYFLLTLLIGIILCGNVIITNSNLNKDWIFTLSAILGAISLFLVNYSLDKLKKENEDTYKKR